MAEPPKQELRAALGVERPVPAHLSRVIPIGPVLTFHKDPVGGLHAYASLFDVSAADADRDVILERSADIQEAIRVAVTERDWVEICGLNGTTEAELAVRAAVDRPLPEAELHVALTRMRGRTVPR